METSCQAGSGRKSEGLYLSCNICESLGQRAKITHLTHLHGWLSKLTYDVLLGATEARKCWKMIFFKLCKVILIFFPLSFVRKVSMVVEPNPLGFYRQCFQGFEWIFENNKVLLGDRGNLQHNRELRTWVRKIRASKNKCGSLNDWAHTCRCRKEAVAIMARAANNYFHHPLICLTVSLYMTSCWHVKWQKIIKNIYK